MSAPLLAAETQSDPEAIMRSLMALADPARREEATATYERARRLAERWNETRPTRWRFIETCEPRIAMISVADVLGVGAPMLADVRSLLDAERIAYSITFQNQHDVEDFEHADLVWILGDGAAPAGDVGDGVPFVANLDEAFEPESVHCERCGRGYPLCARQRAALAIDVRYLSATREPSWDLANTEQGCLVASRRLVQALEAIGATGFQVRDVHLSNGDPCPSIVQLGATAAGCELDSTRTAVQAGHCRRCLGNAGDGEHFVYRDSVGDADFVSIGPHPWTQIYVRGRVYAQLRPRGLVGINASGVLHLSARLQHAPAALR